MLDVVIFIFPVLKSDMKLKHYQLLGSERGYSIFISVSISLMG